MNNFSFKVTTLISLFIMLLSSCTGRRAGIDDSSSNIIGEARLLSLSDHDGYSVARIKNPWDTLAAPAEYYLVERGRDVEVPHGAVKIEVPVERAVVFLQCIPRCSANWVAWRMWQGFVTHSISLILR